MKEKLYEQIEAYLGGNMSSEEQIQFELKVSENSELAKEVALYNQINHHLHEQSWFNEPINNKRGQGDLEEYMRSEEAQSIKSKLEKASKKYEENSGVLNWKYFIGTVAAIGVVILLGVQFWKTSPSNEQLYRKYYTERDLPSLVKRGDKNDMLQKGVIAFKTKEYQNAIAYFEDYLRQTNGENRLPYAYLGFSYLELDHLDKALANFDSLLYSDSLDSSKALWYKSLSYLKHGKIDESKKVLNEILKDSLNFNFKKAEDLILTGL